MTTFHTEEMACPCCDETVKVNLLTSTNNFGGQATDFQSFAVGWDPIMLAINTCENCGFSGYSSDFQQPKSLSPELAEKIKGELLPTVNNQPISPVVSYELAARIAEWRADANLAIADHYLRAAWCCVLNSNPTDEMRYRRQAIGYFEAAFEHEEIEDAHRPNLTYLVGELYRRVGEMEKAAEWFNTVIHAAEQNPDWERAGAFALQQRDTPQERFR